ncbi:MAG: hypothetical protein GQ564_02115 [Bacteroidales bacterium]|nr:hypothetical protein [Bacteroidales bacterium]
MKNNKRILNCIDSRNIENDWTINTAADSDILTAPSRIPNEIDLREKWWKINDQKATGSSVGWAATDSVIRWHFVKEGRLSSKELLSIRFIWMSSKETDEFNRRPTTFIENAGTSLKAALDIARKFGCVKDKDLPFEPSDLFPGKENVFYSNAANFRIRTYYNLNSGEKLNNWRHWLASNGPILTRLDVDDEWYDATDKNGNLDSYNYKGYGGHAIAIVGYTKDRFIIRNSWGEDWGDNGYAYASNNYAEDAFTESYGISI